ncbi:MAG: T9SS type A sorting domain-containing protein [Elusimicrobiota bacterium]
MYVKDGTYTGASNRIYGIPNGSAGAYTKILAETDFGVTLDNTMGTPGSEQYPATVDGVSYAQIQGFNVRNVTGGVNHFWVHDSDHIKIIRCSSDGIAGTGNSPGSSFVAEGGIGSTYVLFEECFSYGGGRYAFEVGGHGTTRNIVFRRCLVRWDFSNVTEPISCFNAYDVDHVYWQNCIAIDGKDITSQPSYTYNGLKGFFNANGGDHYDYQGCIALNMEGMGFYFEESPVSNISLQNCVVWGTQYQGAARGYSPIVLAFEYGTGPVTTTHCTLGVSSYSQAIQNENQDARFTNSILYGFNSLGSGSYALDNSGILTAEDYNCFHGNTRDIATAMGSHDVTINPLANGLKYMTRIETGYALKTAGQGGTPIGAEILYKMGVDGTLYGETGWNSLTTDPLWPFPNEGVIRTACRAFHKDTGAAYTGSPVMDGARGFCADGQTLTKYIWEYLGNPCPAGICEQGSSPTTYYVAVNGNDTNPGTLAQPFATISKALTVMQGGNTLIVRNGTYTDRAGMLVNDHASAVIPSGTVQQFTTIQAESPFGVRLKWTQGLDYYDAPVLIERAQYVHVDGFIYEMLNQESPSYVVDIESNNNKVTRTIVKRSHVDAYGGWYVLGGYDNLVEDAAGVGAARYGFFAGSADAATGRNIFRRCVGRMDFANTAQPKATFCFYGNNAGNNARDAYFQNCIAMDGQRPSSNGGEEKYGGFYNPKNATNVHFQGTIVLNEDVGYAGMFVRELSALDTSVEHAVVYDVHSSGVAGIRANASAGGYYTINRCTIGAAPFGYYNEDSGTTRNLTQTLFYSNGALADGTDYGWTSITSNAFFPAGQATGSNPITNNVTLHYLPRSDLATVGATILYRYGVSGTRWGETGYNQLTGESLWPWPYEDSIASVFSEQLNPPAGYTPTTNNSSRGFISKGLTHYIWEYLGNPCPSNICESSSNTAPTVATAASASPSPVTGTTATLSVLGADDGGEANLTYTWATTGTPPAAVTYNRNGTNAAKSVTATFTRAGSYTFQATIRDAGGLSVTSSVSVTVSATVNSIAVSPVSATVAVNTTRSFSATASDQFSRALTTQPTFTWTVSGGGSINSSGLFTAGFSAGGPYTVTATASSHSGTAQVTVSLNSPPTIQLISPAVGATYTAPATVLWQVRVTSGTAALSRVQLLNGSTVLTTFNNPSSGLLNYTWSSVPTGSYSLSAVVTDTQSLTNMANGSIAVNPAPVSPLPDPDLSGLDGKTFLANDTLNFTYSAAATGFNWTINPLVATASPRKNASLAKASVPTTSPQLHLLDLNLAPGRYQLTVQALNGAQQSNTASARITLQASDLSTIRIYPNPWRKDKHQGHPVTFDTLPPNSTVKIYTLSGHWVKTLATSTASVEWNLDNDAGDKVASGIYLYVITNNQGQKTRGKLVVIK